MSCIAKYANIVLMCLIEKSIDPSHKGFTKVSQYTLQRFLFHFFTTIFCRATQCQLLRKPANMVLSGPTGVAIVKCRVSLCVKWLANFF